MAANRGTEPAKLSKLLKGELDWILLKSLEKDRSRRYETANGLARDIQRYLADELVEARPPSAAYRMKKFLRRNPLQMALTGAVTFLVLSGLSVALWMNVQAGKRREIDYQRQIEDEQRTASEKGRLARTAEAVRALLNLCEESLKNSDSATAQIAMETAKTRFAEGGAEAESERLGRLESDLAMLLNLDGVDQFFPEPGKEFANLADDHGLDFCLIQNRG